MLSHPLKHEISHPLSAVKSRESR